MKRVIGNSTVSRSNEPRDVNDIPYAPMPPKESFTFTATVPASDEPREQMWLLASADEKVYIALDGGKGPILAAVLAEVARLEREYSGPTYGGGTLDAAIRRAAIATFEAMCLKAGGANA